jgi:hypothetical protein
MRRIVTSLEGSSRAGDVHYDLDDERFWLRQAIAAVLEVEQLDVRADDTPQWHQFVIGLAEVYDSVVAEEWESETNAVAAELRRLAALAERIIPPDYALPDAEKTVDVALKLADLSERYGDRAAVARRRLMCRRQMPVFS